MKNPASRPGDTVETAEALAAIRQLLWSNRLQDRSLRFVIDGSNYLLTENEAQGWMSESAALGYSRIRFFLSDDDGKVAVIQLAAIAPLESTTE
jgi:hypothetical protein